MPITTNGTRVSSEVRSYGQVVPLVLGEPYTVGAEAADSETVWIGNFVRVQRFLPWLAMIAVLTWAGCASAATRVQVLDTFPSGATVTLGRNQLFYLHLHYETDHPVRIWVTPYFQGRKVYAGSNPSVVYPSGSGDALGWFNLINPGEQVDEVQITAGDGTIGGTPVVATWPVRVTGGDEAAAGKDRPAWVTRLLARDAAAKRAAYEKYMNRPIGAGKILLLNGLMLAVWVLNVLGVAAPAWGLWRWRGGWRIAAAIPAAMMAFFLLRLVMDMAHDPTSHNLWPLEILRASLLSGAVMAAVLIARRFTKVGRG